MSDQRKPSQAMSLMDRGGPAKKTELRCEECDGVCDVRYGDGYCQNCYVKIEEARDLIKALIAVLICILSYPNSLLASETWFCTSESSKIVGDQIQSCGVGIAPDEAQARSKAFDMAKHEFDTLCAISDECKTRKVAVNPGRTTCEVNALGETKCYRMLMFTLGDSKVPRKAAVQVAPIYAAPVRARSEADIAHDEWMREQDKQSKKINQWIADIYAGKYSKFTGGGGK